MPHVQTTSHIFIAQCPLCATQSLRPEAFDDNRIDHRTLAEEGWERSPAQVFRPTPEPHLQDSSTQPPPPYPPGEDEAATERRQGEGAKRAPCADHLAHVFRPPSLCAPQSLRPGSRGKNRRNPMRNSLRSAALFAHPGQRRAEEESRCRLLRPTLKPHPCRPVAPGRAGNHCRCILAPNPPP